MMDECYHEINSLLFKRFYLNHPEFLVRLFIYFVIKVSFSLLFINFFIFYFIFSLYVRQYPGKIFTINTFPALFNSYFC